MKARRASWIRVSPEDFWESGEVIPPDFNSSEAGLFFFLACRQFRFGPLPDHEPTIALWCQRFRDFKRLWPRVKPLFPCNANGRLENAWVASEASTATALMQAQADRKRRSRGHKRGVSRGRHRDTKDVTVTSQDVTGTSQGVTPTEQNRTEQNKTGHTERVAADAAPAKQTSDHAACFEHWDAEWQRTRQAEKYGFSGSRDGGVFKRLLKLGGLDEVKRRTTRLLESEIPWDWEHAKPTFLESEWNRLGVDLPTPAKQRPLSFAEQTQRNADLAFDAMNRRQAALENGHADDTHTLAARSEAPVRALPEKRGQR